MPNPNRQRRLILKDEFNNFQYAKSNPQVELKLDNAIILTLIVVLITGGPHAHIASNAPATAVISRKRPTMNEIDIHHCCAVIVYVNCRFLLF